MDGNNVPGNVKELFRMLNEQNIQYCFWKGSEHVYAGMIGKGDMDVLFDVTKKATIESILHRVSYVKVHTHAWHSFDGIEDWVGFDKSTCCYTHFHLHYVMIVGNRTDNAYYLPWASLALETRVFNEADDIWVCNPNLEIIVLLFRMLLARYKKMIKKR